MAEEGVLGVTGGAGSGRSSPSNGFSPLIAESRPSKNVFHVFLPSIERVHQALDVASRQRVGQDGRERLLLVAHKGIQGTAGPLAIVEPPHFGSMA